MQLYYWNPMREMAETQRQLSAFFNGTLHQESRPQNGHVSWTPAVDVSETADAYTFTVELPGVNPEAVEVEVKNGTLTIKGERVSTNAKEGERYYRQERPMGRFARGFHLPKPVNSDGVTAMYRDGILSVTLPLREEAKPRRISVQG